MGRLLKLDRLLPSGRKALIVAMDQPRAIYSGALADPGSVLDKLRGADVDGYLLTLGTARHVESHLAGRAVVVSISQDYQGAQQVVEQAVAFGASALKYEVYPCCQSESVTMRGLEALAVHADRWGLPIMAEVVPGGFDDVALHTAINLRDSVRRAAEAGADVAKIPPPNDGALAEVTEYASIPVLLLGGARRGGLQEVLARVRQLGPAVDGLVFGRYVVEDPEPASVVAALREALDSVL
jgi:DhnA family fructose-bisphosphate aldolase class Ia